MHMRCNRVGNDRHYGKKMGAETYHAVQLCNSFLTFAVTNSYSVLVQSLVEYLSHAKRFCYQGV